MIMIDNGYEGCGDDIIDVIDEDDHDDDDVDENDGEGSDDDSDMVAHAGTHPHRAVMGGGGHPALVQAEHHLPTTADISPDDRDSRPPLLTPSFCMQHRIMRGVHHPRLSTNSFCMHHQAIWSAVSSGEGSRTRLGDRVEVSHALAALEGHEQAP
jgi:hypothetical protein